MPSVCLVLIRRATFAALAVIGLVLTYPILASTAFAQDDPLPSWNDGAVKTAILNFVGKVTHEGAAGFVPVEQRIAVFDNDGTLWSEQPAYFQAAFMFDRIRAMAKDHPEWQQKQPYKAVLDGDIKSLAGDQKSLAQLLAVTHSGMSVAAFAAIVEDWMKAARHPRFDRPYTDLVFQPMLELLAYLRANGFKTFIVSGGGVEFMRPWVPQVYGIPPEQIIGSSGKTEFRLNGGKPVIYKLPAVEFVDDGPGKPVGINRFIGRRPVFAAGNSDGDLQMLQWTTLNDGPRFALIVHHTDAKREWAYDRKSTVGRLDKALDEAPSRGWTVVDMKSDWKIIYPFEKE
jgi:hypothetical protein